jgi:hypothetical protein
VKHENGKECESCAKKLEGADPLIAHWFYELKDQFPTAHISCAFRGKEEQDRMVLEKASLLKWPHSKHNVMVKGQPNARAIDLFSLNDEGEAEFRIGFYVQIANWLEDRESPISWGGRWRWSDPPHFELKD